MPSNCYSFGFPSVHTHFLFLLSFPLDVHRGLIFFLFWTLWLPRCRSIQPGSSSGPEATANNQERPEQKRECSSGGIRGNAPCPEGGARLWRAHASIAFDHGMLCVKHKTTLVLSWWRGEHSFHSVQSSWVLALFRVSAPTPSSDFPYLFSCQMVQVQRGSGQQHGNCKNWQADSTIHMEMKRT